MKEYNTGKKRVTELWLLRMGFEDHSSAIRVVFVYLEFIDTISTTNDASCKISINVS